MQLRRVLLLFALVLGLSALVTSIVSPPETSEERTPAPETAPTPRAAIATDVLRLAVPAGARKEGPATRRAAVGSRVSVEVSVPGPGDVTVDGLGLRQSADSLTPARFDLLASRPGRHAVVFAPVGGRPRVAGRLAFAEPASVRPRARARR